MNFGKALDLIDEGYKSVHWNSRENKNYNKHKYHWIEGDDSFSAGRERIVSAVCNRVRKSGTYIDRNTVRNYVYDIAKKKPEERPDWIKKAASRAKAMGYDPDDESDQKAITKKDEKGYKGRAFYFSALMNGYTNHFTGGKNKDKSKKK